jgi:trehalose synthase-fused probable maltokinase
MNSFDQNLVVAALRHRCPEVLPDFLRNRRWFAGKARTIGAIEILDVVPVEGNQVQGYLVLSRVAYSSGPAEIYDVPLAVASGDLSAGVEELSPRLKVQLPGSGGEVEFTDALWNAEFLNLLLDAISHNRGFPGANGRVGASAGSSLGEILHASRDRLVPVLNRGEQSNSSIIYGKKLILKLFRRLEPGINPDIEMGSFLTEKTSFRNIAPVAGGLQYACQDGQEISLGILQTFVPNQGDAWEFTLRQVAAYYRGTEILPLGEGNVDGLQNRLVEFARHAIPAEARSQIGEYLQWAELLGRRTAELHLALASSAEDEDFRPQPFTEADRREFTAAAESSLSSTFQLLRDQRSVLPADLCLQAEKVLGKETELRDRLLVFKHQPISVQRTRIHGDYHLGQVLFTGTDFVIIDFEGEPSRPLAERRKKRSPLQDVAGMLRSFHYAAYAELLKAEDTSETQASRMSDLRIWASYWQKWVSVAFLRKYVEVAGDASFIPRSQVEFTCMLDMYLLEKAIYELGYELNNRPNWVRTPLEGISQLLEKVVQPAS